MKNFNVSEDVRIIINEGEVTNKPFIVACRDREAATEERWVLASLTCEEAKYLHNTIEMFFR